MHTTNPSFASDLGHWLQQAGTFVIALTALGGAILWIAKPHMERYFTNLIQRLIRPIQEKTDAIHKTTTVNSGTSNPPTMLDEVHAVADKVATALTELAEVSSEIKQITVATGANAQRASDLADRMDDVHDLAAEARDLSKQTRDEFRVHEAEGEQYLGKVRLVMKTQGIELPDHREP